jgi:hypothetical protein
MSEKPEYAGMLRPATSATRALTAHDFQQLAGVSPASCWFANIDNEQTHRVHKGNTYGGRKVEIFRRLVIAKSIIVGKSIIIGKLYVC